MKRRGYQTKKKKKENENYRKITGIRGFSKGLGKTRDRVRSLDNRRKQGNETAYTLELVTNCDMVSFVVVRQHSL